MGARFLEVDPNLRPMNQKHNPLFSRPLAGIKYAGDFEIRPYNPISQRVLEVR
jgi:hypothetical protein